MFGSASLSTVDCNVSDRDDYYTAYLSRVVRSTAENAAASGRVTHYRMLATISSGYDSPACATIASAVGCDEAVSFGRARGDVPDDGLEVGRHLDMRVILMSRPIGTTGLEASFPEFFATGMQGEDLVYATLSDLVPRRLLITGFHGGAVWDPHVRPTSAIKRGDISGSSLGEFRLLRDFVHLPLPFVGAQRQGDLVRIGRSAEMRSYSVGGYYDRPIPRRIVEQSGIPRSAFGQTKKAGSILIFFDRKLMPTATRRAIEGASNLGFLGWVVYRMRFTWFRLGLWVFGLRIRGARILPPRARAGYQALWNALRRLVFGQWEVFHHGDPLMAFALKWAVEKMSSCYKKKMSSRYKR